MQTWPTDEDCDRALHVLNEERLAGGYPVKHVDREMMRKVLKAGLNKPDTRTQEEKDYEFDRLLGR